MNSVENSSVEKNRAASPHWSFNSRWNHLQTGCNTPFKHLEHQEHRVFSRVDPWRIRFWVQLLQEAGQIPLHDTFSLTESAVLSESSQSKMNHLWEKGVCERRWWSWTSRTVRGDCVCLGWLWQKHAVQMEHLLMQQSSCSKWVSRCDLPAAPLAAAELSGAHKPGKTHQSGVK